MAPFLTPYPRARNNKFGSRGQFHLKYRGDVRGLPGDGERYAGQLADGDGYAVSGERGEGRAQLRLMRGARGGVGGRGGEVG